MTTLAFYDHHRQIYGEQPIRDKNAVAEFGVGDFDPDDDGGVGPLGEFTIHLYHLYPDETLTFCVRAFGDAIGALREFDRCGALDAVLATPIARRDDLSVALIEAGLKDVSDRPLDRTCGHVSKILRVMCGEPLGHEGPHVHEIEHERIEWSPR